MSDVNPCFSEDIWFEILKNLPVKTLGKCRCVCKSWHSLIVSPSFMASHLKHYTQNDTNSLLLYRDIFDNSRKHEQYLFFLESGYIPLLRCHTAICPFKIDCLKRQRSYVVGFIHGLLCLSDKPYLAPTSQIMIWNPFLQKMINLPMSMAATIGWRKLTSVLGFGYDSNKNDHRVVKISYSRVDHGVNPLVEVYSVCKRIWNTIPTNYLADNSISSFSDSHCFLNGVIHWLAWPPGSYYSHAKWVLISFDVTEETFQKIELPESIKMWTGRVRLCEYKAKLSVLLFEHHLLAVSFTFAKCQIWVKEVESWCTILNIVVQHLIFTGPFEYLGKDGKLFGFSRTSDRMLLFYDLTTRQFIELGLYRHVSSKFSTFTDSLVLLDQDTDLNSDD